MGADSSGELGTRKEAWQQVQGAGPKGASMLGVKAWVGASMGGTLPMVVPRWHSPWCGQTSWGAVLVLPRSG